MARRPIVERGATGSPTEASTAGATPVSVGFTMQGNAFPFTRIAPFSTAISAAPVSRDQKYDLSFPARLHGHSKMSGHIIWEALVMVWRLWLQNKMRRHPALLPPKPSAATSPKAQAPQVSR